MVIGVVGDGIAHLDSLFLDGFIAGRANVNVHLMHFGDRVFFIWPGDVVGLGPHVAGNEFLIIRQYIDPLPQQTLFRDAADTFDQQKSIRRDVADNQPQLIHVRLEH